MSFPLRKAFSAQLTGCLTAQSTRLCLSQPAAAAAPCGWQKDIALKADKFTLCHHQVKSQVGSVKRKRFWRRTAQRKTAIRKLWIEMGELKWVTLAGNQSEFSDVCSCANWVLWGESLITMTRWSDGDGDGDGQSQGKSSQAKWKRDRVNCSILSLVDQRAPSSVQNVRQLKLFALIRFAC